MVCWAGPAAITRGTISNMFQVSLAHAQGPSASPSQGGEPLSAKYSGGHSMSGGQGADTWPPLTAEAVYSLVPLQLQIKGNIKKVKSHV